MNILFLQGPNLNLLGLQSSKINKDRLTLCKLNRHLKKYLRNTPHKIKIFQTHKEFQAINYLQRNRNWSDGHLIIPTTWSINNWTIAETLKILNIPTITVFFNKPYDMGGNKSRSVFKSENIFSTNGSPINASMEGLKKLLEKE